MDTSRNTPRRQDATRRPGPAQGFGHVRHPGLDRPRSSSAAGGSAVRPFIDLTADTTSSKDDGGDSAPDDNDDPIDSIFDQIAPSASHTDSDADDSDMDDKINRDSINATPTMSTSGAAVTAHFQNNLQNNTWVRKPAATPATPSKSSADARPPRPMIAATPLLAALNGSDVDGPDEGLREPPYHFITMRSRARRSRQNSHEDKHDLDEDEDNGDRDSLYEFIQEQKNAKAAAQAAQAAQMQLRCMSPGTADRLASANQDPSFRTPSGKPLSRDQVVRVPMRPFPGLMRTPQTEQQQRRTKSARPPSSPTRSRSVSPSRPPRSKDASKAAAASTPRPASSIAGAPASTPANRAHRPPYPSHPPPPFRQGTPISTPARPPASASATQARPISQLSHSTPFPAHTPRQQTTLATPVPQHTQPPNPNPQPVAATSQMEIRPVEQTPRPPFQPQHQPPIRQQLFGTPAPAPQPALSIRERLAQQYAKSAVQSSAGMSAPSTPVPERTQHPKPTSAAASPQIVIRKVDQTPRPPAQLQSQPPIRQQQFIGTPAPAPQPALSIRERLAQQYSNSAVQLGAGSTASARRPAYQPVPVPPASATKPTAPPGTPIGIPSAQELLQSRAQSVQAPPGTPLAVPGAARNMANMTPVPGPRFGPPPVFGTPGATRTPFGGAGGVPGGGQFQATPMRQPYGSGAAQRQMPADKAGLLRLMQDVMPEELMNEFKANPWTQPEPLKTTLLPHQVLGVRWMMKTESTLGGGILADDMGLGKTMQSITLMLANPPADDQPRQRTTLVIAPVSLLAQWETEIKEHVHPGTLKVLVHNGANRTKDARILGNYDVVITNYELIGGKKEVNMAMFEVDWHRIILDEGHRIRNDSTKSSKHCIDLRARYRWILTGTPLQNSVDELFSYFKFLRCPGYPTKPSWTADFGKGANAKRGPAAMTKLQELLKRYVLRRSKDLIDLPDKLIVQEMLDLSPAEREFYDKVQGVAKKAAEKAADMNTNKVRMAYLALLLRMRQAVLHPELVKSGATEAPEMDWSVGEPAAAAPVEEENVGGGDDYLDDLLANMSVMFGDMSLDLSLDDDGTDGESGSSRNRPPKPKQLSTVVEPEGITMAGARLVKEHVIVEPPVGRPRHDYESTKVLRALQILRSPHKLNPRTKQPKTILFSQFTSLLAVMARALKAEGIAFLMYDGKLSQPQRKQVLERFRTDSSIPVLLMSLQCGSVGLNLTCASRVILFDPWWNPQIEFQAMDRVHRLGQTHPVAVHKLGILDSVEERIFDMQDRKRALANEALGNVVRDQDGNMVMPSAQLSTDDLLKLVMG